MPLKTALIGRCVISYLVVAGALSPARSVADNDVWKTAANGSWSAGLSWTDGTSPDSASDQATIARAGAYTVSFVSNPTIGALTLSGSANVTFASTVKPPATIPTRSLLLTKTGSLSGNLSVQSGATLTLGSVTGGSPATSPFNLTAAGSLQVDATSSLNVAFGSIVSSAGATNDFNGNINVTAGSVSLNGASRIGASDDGVVTVSGAGSRMSSNQLFLGSNVDSRGALFITAGGIVECFSGDVGPASFDSFTSAATVTVTGADSLWKVTNGLTIGSDNPGANSGTVSIGSGGTVSVGQATVVNRRGRIRLEGGVFNTGEFLLGDASSGLDWISGTYHVGTHHDNLSNPSGTLSPGHSAGVTTVIGDYTQGSSGKLEIEIGGAAQGSQFDFLNVTEDVQLGGRLDLNLIGGFVPTSSQTFTIVNSDAVVGAFANVASGQRLALSSGTGSFVVHYGVGSPFNPNQVVLGSYQPGGLSGDFDVDGDVDGNDFLLWQRGGSPNSLSGGDLAIWRANFGSATPVGGSVPEPSTGRLAISITLVAWLAAKRRARYAPVPTIRSPRFQLSDAGFGDAFFLSP